MKILVVNAGSSSLKCSFFALQNGAQSPDQTMWSAEIEWSGDNAGMITVETKGRKLCDQEKFESPHEKTVERMFATLWTGADKLIAGPEEIDVVGHRVVHGGRKYSHSVLIDDEVMSDIHDYIELAPAHEPANIEGIESARKTFPRAKQVAVFDTSFHHNLPETSFLYAVPYEWYEKSGIRRYGFHGISHAYCANRFARLMNEESAQLRLITCHLGSGCSITAVKDGSSVMTTMGYTPLEGVIMRTRSGTIDPGLVVQLIEDGKYSASELARILNKESGLKGVSGLSGDMRDIEEQVKQGNKRAQLAFEMFITSVAANVSALVSYMGGLDGLAFTGGIGENSASVRRAVCDRLAFLGIKIDERKNHDCKEDSIVSAPGNAKVTAVIKCREDIAIAQECLRLCSIS